MHKAIFLGGEVLQRKRPSKTPLRRTPHFKFLPRMMTSRKLRNYPGEWIKRSRSRACRDVMTMQRTFRESAQDITHCTDAGLLLLTSRVDRCVASCNTVRLITTDLYASQMPMPSKSPIMAASMIDGWWRHVHAVRVESSARCNDATVGGCTPSNQGAIVPSKLIITTWNHTD